MFPPVLQRSGEAPSKPRRYFKGSGKANLGSRSPSPDDIIGIGQNNEDDKSSVRHRQSTLQKLTDLYGETMTDLTLISSKKLSNLTAKNEKQLQKQMILSSKHITAFTTPDSSTSTTPEMPENALVHCKDAKKLYGVWDKHRLELQRMRAPPTLTASASMARHTFNTDVQDYSAQGPGHSVNDVQRSVSGAGSVRDGRTPQAGRLGAAAAHSSPHMHSSPFIAATASARQSHQGGHNRDQFGSPGTPQQQLQPHFGSPGTPQYLQPIHHLSQTITTTASHHSVPVLKLGPVVSSSALHPHTAHSPTNTHVRISGPHDIASLPATPGASSPQIPASNGIVTEGQPSANGITPRSRLAVPPLSITQLDSIAGAGAGGDGVSPGPVVRGVYDRTLMRTMSKQDTRYMLQQAEAVLQSSEEAPLLTHARAHTASLSASQLTLSPRQLEAAAAAAAGSRPESPSKLTTRTSQQQRPGSQRSPRLQLHLLPNVAEEGLGTVEPAAAFTPRQASPRPFMLSPRARGSSPLAPPLTHLTGLRPGSTGTDHTTTQITAESAADDGVVAGVGDGGGGSQGVSTPILTSRTQQDGSDAQALPSLLMEPVAMGEVSEEAAEQVPLPLDDGPYDAPRALVVGGYSVVPYTGVFTRSAEARQEAAMRFVQRVMHCNPAGFVEDVAASEVAAYREAAERGRAILAVTQLLPADLTGSQALRGSMQELHFRRPYFLSSQPEEPVGVLVADPMVSLGLRAARRPRMMGGDDEDDDGGMGLSTGRASASSRRWTWRPEMSIFAPRAVESDARALNDNSSVKERQLQVDWRRIVAKDSFKLWLVTTDPNIRSGSAPLEKVQDAIYNVLLTYWNLLKASFTYYALADQQAGQVALLVSAQQWNTMLNDCGLGELVTPRTGETVFTSACGGGAVTSINGPEFEAANKLMRFEWFEALVRVGSMRYLHTGMVPGTAEALRTLIKQDLLPHLHPAAQYDPLPFRDDRLYTEEVDSVLREAGPVLHALYSCSCASAGSRYMRLGQWLEMLHLHGMLGDHTGLSVHNAALAFGWSQLLVVDELQRRQRAASMDLLDMAEGLARLADMVSPPSLEEVEQLLSQTGLMSQEELAAVMVHHPYHTFYSLAEMQPESFCPPRRASGGIVNNPTRPLAEKLSALLDYMLTAICASWDCPDTDRLIIKLNHVTAMLGQANIGA